jgi:ABC-type transporter Mla MlaB component
MPNDKHESWRDRSLRSKGTVPPAAARGDRVVDLDVSWLVPADLGAVDALARLQLVVSRCGCSLQLHGADGGLAELLEFVGLKDVMHLCPCSAGARCAANRPCAREDRSLQPPP